MRHVPRPLLLILLWLAPPAWAEDSEEAPEDDQELEDFQPIADEPEPEGPYRHSLTPFAGLQASACLPLSELDMGLHGRLSAGAWLPWLGGRLLPVVELGFATVGSSGLVEDERLPDGEPYRWELTMRQLELGGGLHLRALRADAPFSPELGVAAHGVRVHSSMTGAIGGADTQPVHELSWRLGWRATGGMAVALGPGALTVELGYRAVPMDGVLSGETSLSGLVAGLGYRGFPW